VRAVQLNVRRCRPVHTGPRELGDGLGLMRPTADSRGTPCDVVELRAEQPTERLLVQGPCVQPYASSIPCSSSALVEVLPNQEHGARQAGLSCGSGQIARDHDREPPTADTTWGAGRPDHHLPLALPLPLALHVHVHLQLNLHLHFDANQSRWPVDRVGMPTTNVCASIKSRSSSPRLHCE